LLNHVYRDASVKWFQGTYSPRNEPELSTLVITDVVLRSRRTYDALLESFGILDADLLEAFLVGSLEISSTPTFF